MSFQPFILVIKCEGYTLHLHRLRVTFTKEVFLLKKLNLGLERWFNGKEHLLFLQMN